MARTVIAMYDDFTTASRAVNELVDRGFDRQAISLVANDAAREYAPHVETYEDIESRAGNGGATGAGLGAVIGGLGGLLVGLGALAIPGIGPVLAAGPLVTALAGAGAGALAGGLLGALVDMGIPEEQAGYFAEGVRRGGTLVTVKVEDADARRAAEILDRYGPVDINERVDNWRERGWRKYTPGGDPYEAAEIEAERQYYEPNQWRVGYDLDPDFDPYEDTFRSHYQDQYAGSRYTFDDYLPAYYYGYTLAHDDRYRDRDWFDIEPDVRRDWERDYPDHAWEDFKASVRHAWEEIKAAVR